MPRERETDSTLEARVRTAEVRAARDGSPCVFRLTPFSPPELDDYLEARGYRIERRTAVLQRGTLRHPPRPRTRLHALAPEAWLERWRRMSEGAADPLRLKEILRTMTAPRILAALDAGTPARTVCCGMAVVERDLVGLYDLVTAPHERRRGYGEAMVRSLLAWGAETGARHAYLQVAHANEAAWRLYTRLGFEWLYDYWYRVGPEASVRSGRG